MRRSLALWSVAGALGLAAGVARMTFANRMSGPRWDRLMPAMQAKTLQLVDAANAAGLGVMFWEGWRAPEQSAANIAAGTSKIKDPFDSLHVWGAGVDIVFRGPLGAPQWPKIEDPRWRQLANIGASLGLRSGLLMWGWDAPHFQLAGVNVAQLRRQYGQNYLAWISGAGQTTA